MKFKTMTGGNHGMVEGEVFEIRYPDNRWWRHLWFWLTFRKNPTHAKVYTVSSISSSTTFEVR
jgi:hypothetical protein